MNQIFKSLLRYKSSTILNIVGLSCAFATFIIISMQIRYDVTYDTHHKNHDSIYQLVFKNESKGELNETFDRPLIVKIGANTPSIEYISALSRRHTNRITLLGDNEFDVVQEIYT